MISHPVGTKDCVILPQSFTPCGRHPLALWYAAPAAAMVTLDNDPNYSGMKKRLQRLDRHTKEHAAAKKITHTPFLGTTRQTDWHDQVNRPRNRAMHAGYNAFTGEDARTCLVTATKTIIFLDNRIPALAHPIQLTSSPNLQPYAGPIFF